MGGLGQGLSQTIEGWQLIRFQRLLRLLQGTCIEGKISADPLPFARHLLSLASAPLQTGATGARGRRGLAAIMPTCHAVYHNMLLSARTLCF